jgi:hypothetical protein
MTKSEDTMVDGARAKSAHVGRPKLRRHGAALALCAVVACSAGDRPSGAEAEIVARDVDASDGDGEEGTLTTSDDSDPRVDEQTTVDIESAPTERDTQPPRGPARDDVDATCVRDRLTGLLSQGSAPNIVIDGKLDDWKDVATITVAGREENGEQLRVTADCDNLYVLAEADTMPEETELLIDADGDPATGRPFKLNDKWSGSGIDHAFFWNFRKPGDGSEWKVTSTSDLRSYGNAKAVEYKYAVKEHRGELPARFGLAFRMITRPAGSGEVVVQIPSRGMWRMPAGYEKRGMIIPAYLPASAGAGWDALVKARDAMRVVPADLVDDFWVVISGSTKGAPTADSPFAEWHEVQKHGAKLFGYVHSCKNPDPSDAGVKADAATVHVCERLRGRDEVEDDVELWKSSIQDWNKENPKQQITLSGIWVDEFYPKFEGTEPEHVGRPTATTTGDQRDPSGHYFDQLVESIRATDSSWQVIGNAGGPLPSNLLRYAELLDVVCSFEADISQVEYQPERGDDVGRPGMTLQALRPRYGQLALVHGNQSRMAEVVRRAFDEGYSHVYTTSLTHSIDLPEGGTALNNVWGDVPSYLEAQAALVKRTIDGGTALPMRGTSD